MGLGFENLSRINPGLIHVAITGFGKKTPGRDYRCCDIVASAFGGQMYIMGYPEGPPRAPFGEQSYYAVSLFGAVQALLALKKRAQTGKGEYIDLSLQEAVVSTLDHVMVHWFYENTITKRQGNLYGNSFCCILRCKDGYIQLTLLQQWETLVELMATEGMARDLTDEKWKDEAYRIKYISHIIDVTAEWTKNHTTGELFEMGQTMRFPWAPVCSPQEVLKSPQLKARQFFISMDQPGGKTRMLCPGLPYKFSSFPSARIRRAPLLGEHNEALAGGTIWPQRPRSSTVPPSPTNSSPSAAEGGVLRGVRVLDFTRILAGPYATRILADCGAEVIKVQSEKTAKGAELNTSGYFNTWNRNKCSVMLDVSHPEARDIILRLTALSDVVVENFSPHVMSNWGLSYEQLKKANPKIIVAGISAMGQTGPWRDYVGYGPTFHALSGLTYMTSLGQGSPVGLGHAYADTIIGLYATLGILVALQYRERTGEGQYIDISGYEALCTLLGPTLLDSGINEKINPTKYHYDDPIPGAPYGCYRCTGDDTWCVIAIFDDNDWHTFCRIADRHEWIADDALSSPAKRKEHRALLDKLVGEWTSQYTPEALVDLLQGAGIAAGVVQNAEGIAGDPNLAARNFFIELEHPILGNTVSERSALMFTKERRIAWKAAPLLGADNQYVFVDLLGFSESDISLYKEKGVIA